MLTVLSPRRPNVRTIATVFLVMVAVSACTSESPKPHFVLAEELWKNKQYEAAAAKFDQVAKLDPRGELGTQALFRSAMTLSLFIQRHPDAVERLELFTEWNQDLELDLKAQLEIGEILYNRQRKYVLAIAKYEHILAEYLKDSGDQRRAEALFRIGKSNFFLWEFEKAVSTYQKIASDFAGTPWAERAQFETAVALYTGGDRAEDSAGGFKQAKEAYEKFLKNFPKSELTSQARFGIANCLEEMDMLPQAQAEYERLLNRYPAKGVIEVKLKRIEQRLAQKTSARKS